ncbi:MAG: CHRD domain-containing protein [Fimbriimonadaceae bacterium]|nr:CHRD domain-containing protein [Fimbriimonadaceae bacterium]
MKRTLLFALAAISTSAFAQFETFSTLSGITGSQEVPATGHGGLGAATFTVDTGSLLLTGSVSVAGLPWGDVTGFHIHNAAAGVNGPVVVNFMSSGSTTGTDPWLYTANTTITQSVLDAMRLGNTYVNVHTAAFPGGAIRGQLSPVPEPASLAALGVGALALLRRRRKA